MKVENWLLHNLSTYPNKKYSNTIKRDYCRYCTTMTKKKKITFSVGIVLLAMLLGLLIGVMTAPKLDAQYWQQQEMMNTRDQRINTMLYLIDNFYVDKVDYDSITDEMMNSLLSTLDPHSAYLTPSVYEKEAESLNGQFEGIGLTLYYIDDTVYAYHAIPGAPAAKAGLHAGDRIIRVDTTTVSGTGMTENGKSIVDLIRGPRFSTVELTVQRQGSKKLHTFKVRRDVIHTTSVPAHVMLDNKTGYIRISNFGSTTATEFHAALLELLHENMQQLVLDLRGNGGGSLEAAIGVCDELLPKGDLIVYTQGEHVSRSDIYATSGGLFEEDRLTVLIDEESASASEIVAGAMQDNDRGTIVGHRSFGKGLVQRQYPMPGGAAVLLTIARYYTPSGRCIQRPYDMGTDEYYRQYITRIIQNYVAADSILDAEYDTTQTFLTKKGRKVYGGGGIRPDILLPYFSDTNLIYYNQLISNRVLEEHMFEQLFNNYDQIISRYPTIEQFVKNYQVDDATWQSILALADKKNITRRPAGIKKYGDAIRNRYKATLASTLYGENAYYKIALTGDIELQNALKKLKIKK